MRCPKCLSTIIEKSDCIYGVVTINPTTPHYDNVYEYKCEACETKFFAQEPHPGVVLPELFITEVVNASYDASRNEVTVKAGNEITIKGELRYMGQLISNYTGNFRMPIRSYTDNEKIVEVNVVGGLAQMVWTPKESGIWKILASLLNRDIPPEQHVSFAGLKIYVLD